MDTQLIAGHQVDVLSAIASAQHLADSTREKYSRAVERFLQEGGDIFNADQLAEDVTKITDAARGRFMSALGMGISVIKNYDPFKAPTHFTLKSLLEKFDKTYGVTGRDYGKVTPDRTFEDVIKRRQDRWNFLFIAGMWFQDLFTYDFRRTEQCVIPYGTQEGEISFCAYNTGAGWRQIVENIHRTATTAEWYSKKGRHHVFAGGKSVPLTRQGQEAAAARLAKKASERADIAARKRNGSRKVRLPVVSAGP